MTEETKCICGYPISFDKYIIEDGRVVADVYVCNRCGREFQIILNDIEG